MIYKGIHCLCSPSVLSHPTARRTLPVHPNHPFPSLFLLSLFTPAFFFTAAQHLSILFSLYDLPFSLSSSFTCLTIKPPTATDLPAGLACNGAEGCNVTFCPSMSPCLLPTDLLRRTGNLSQKDRCHNYIPLSSSFFPLLLPDGNRGQEKSIITLQIISNIYQGNSLVITTDCKP